MKKYILTAALLALICGTASAQGILGRLGERAKQAVENNLGNKVEKGLNDLLDGKKKERKTRRLAKTRNRKKPPWRPRKRWISPRFRPRATSSAVRTCSSRTT